MHTCVMNARAYLGDLIVREGRVRRHEEVTARRRDERGDDADQVVVHVSRVPQGCRRCRHDRRNLCKQNVSVISRAGKLERRITTHKLVGLFEARVLRAQPVRGNLGERSIVEDDD